MAHMAACRTGPTVSQDDQSCWDADYDGDGDVDLDDFGVFQHCYSGSQPALDSIAAFTPHIDGKQGVTVGEFDVRLSRR